VGAALLVDGLGKMKQGVWAMHDQATPETRNSDKVKLLLVLMTNEARIFALLVIPFNYETTHINSLSIVPKPSCAICNPPSAAIFRGVFYRDSLNLLPPFFYITVRH
jgi:hypothetical protein